MYVSRCVPGVGPLLAPIEEATQQHFLPALLGAGEKKLKEAGFRRLLGNAVKNGGLAIATPLWARSARAAARWQ